MDEDNYLKRPEGAPEPERSMMNIYMGDGTILSIPADADWSAFPPALPQPLQDTHIRVDAPGYAYILNRDMIKMIIINKPEQPALELQDTELKVEAYRAPASEPHHEHLGPADPADPNASLSALSNC